MSVTEFERKADGGLVERLVRAAFAPYDNVVMGDPGASGPSEKDVVALIHSVLAGVTNSYESAMQAEGVKHYRRSLVHRAAIEALRA